MLFRAATGGSNSSSVNQTTVIIRAPMSTSMQTADPNTSYITQGGGDGNGAVLFRPLLAA